MTTAPTPATSVNLDTATLVKPTRWHVRTQDMLITGTGAGLLADALADERPIIPPASVQPIPDLAAARAALDEADSRLLLMSLVHLTGEETLLDRYAPYIGAQFAGGAKGVANHDIPAEMEAELRDKLIAALNSGAKEQPVSARLAQKMMSVCAGEPVGPEFVPLLLEQAGFTDVQGLVDGTHAKAREGFKVVVIGAGMSGIACGIKLGELGYDYEIIERNTDVGGTWFLNRYPGVGVDTPSHYYSYSFEINPEWPRYFSKGDALLAYFRDVAEKYGIRKNISFGTEVKSCVYNDGTKRWTVTISNLATGAERVIQADAVIPGISQTNRPEVPEIAGMDRFKGEIAHTARWDDVDLAGKRVVVIGTGASSMQICTTIAPQVGHLTIFQRSKHWIVPSPLAGKEVPEGAKWAMRHVPYYGQWQRFITYWTGSDGTYPVAVVDPDWHMPDVSVSAANERRRQVLLAYIGKELAGRPDLIEKVTPDYPPMGKRIILDAGWYKMLRRENVEIENVGIDHIDETGIVMTDGRRVDADVIVLATGFRFRPMLSSVEIVGKGGLSLSEAWKDENPRAYLGILVPNFPNLFLINGPNSAANHGAGANLFSEGALNYILGLLDILERNPGATIEPDLQAFQDYNDAIDENLRGMVWNHPKASSYYLNGQRRNTVSCPWRLVDYWWMMRTPKEEDLVIG